MTEVTNGLLALLTALVGALVWVVKKSDNRQTRLIETLIQAVAAFQRFETDQTVTNAEILRTQGQIVEAQQRMLALLDRIDQRTIECLVPKRSPTK